VAFQDPNYVNSSIREVVSCILQARRSRKLPRLLLIKPDRTCKKLLEAEGE
jgi:hypothetical protein